MAALLFKCGQHRGTREHDIPLTSYTVMIFIPYKLGIKWKQDFVL